MPSRMSSQTAMELHDLVLQDHVARGLSEIAGDDLDQRRLAGPVVSHQAEHLARLERQVHLGERRDHPEVFRDLLQLENRHGAANLDAPVPGGGANRPIIQRNTQTRPPLVSAVRGPPGRGCGRGPKPSFERNRLVAPASFASPAPVPSSDAGKQE